MFSDLCKSVLKLGDEVLIPGVGFTGRDAVQRLNC
jgi:tartrate dehydratase beta subunit/fumarate hydratase class I family protein